MSDTLFFFSSVGIWIFISVFFILYRIKSRMSKNFIYFLLLNIVILLVYSYLWFFHIAIDGISQVAGTLLYGIIALILIIIQTIICNVKGSSQRNNRNK